MPNWEPARRKRPFISRVPAPTVLALALPITVIAVSATTLAFRGSVQITRPSRTAEPPPPQLARRPLAAQRQLVFTRGAVQITRPSRTAEPPPQGVQIARVDQRFQRGIIYQSPVRRENPPPQAGVNRPVPVYRRDYRDPRGRVYLSPSRNPPPPQLTRGRLVAQRQLIFTRGSVWTNRAHHPPAPPLVIPYAVVSDILQYIAVVSDG